jgi:hypothetical protein
MYKIKFCQKKKVQNLMNKPQLSNFKIKIKEPIP